MKSSLAHSCRSRGLSNLHGATDVVLHVLQDQGRRRSGSPCPRRQTFLEKSDRRSAGALCARRLESVLIVPLAAACRAHDSTVLRRESSGEVCANESVDARNHQDAHCSDRSTWAAIRIALAIMVKE